MSDRTPSGADVVPGEAKSSSHDSEAPPTAPRPARVSRPASSAPQNPALKQSTSDAPASASGDVDPSTLMGVAPPQRDPLPVPASPRPVAVRAGMASTWPYDDEAPTKSDRRDQSVAPNTISNRYGLHAPAEPLLGVLNAHVRFAGGEVPLWSVIAPIVLLLIVLTAVIAASLSARPVPPSKTAASASASAMRKRPPPTVQAVVVKAPEYVVSDATLKAIEAKPEDSRTAPEILMLNQGHDERDRKAAKTLRESLEKNPALIMDGAVLADLQKYSTRIATAPEALAAMAAVPGALSPDLIYDVWTGTAERTEATELARSLVYSADVRTKASVALAVALELRAAETCEQFKDILPRAVKDGDRRSWHLLNKLKRRQGCGASKRQDCYACLRTGNALDKAINALKNRREPTPFGKP